MVDLSDISIESEEIVYFLKKNLKIKEIYQNLLFQKIINRAAQERKIIVTPEEIQAKAEQSRREKQLEKAADTLNWLREQIIAPEDWEAGIHDYLLAEKLSHALFAQEVDPVFAQNRLNFDQVILYQIILPYEQLSWEIFYQIEEEEMNFYQAAHLYDIDERRRLYCGYEGQLYRWSIQPDLAAVIFNAEPNKIIPPFKSDKGYHLLLVEEFIEAELTPETHQEILDKLFNEWLLGELNYWLHNS